MASSPKIKATYSLDPATVRLLERVSRRWGVSKSEALRRAIHASAAEKELSNEKLEVLDRAQREGDLTPARATAWKKRVRAERRAASRGGIRSQ
jgi:hypothetical protein